MAEKMGNTDIDVMNCLLLLKVKVENCWALYNFESIFFY